MTQRQELDKSDGYVTMDRLGRIVIPASVRAKLGLLEDRSLLIVNVEGDGSINLRPGRLVPIEATAPRDRPPAQL